jgi:hypothetical protein
MDLVHGRRSSSRWRRPPRTAGPRWSKGCQLPLTGNARIDRTDLPFTGDDLDALYLLAVWRHEDPLTLLSTRWPLRRGGHRVHGQPRGNILGTSINAPTSALPQLRHPTHTQAANMEAGTDPTSILSTYVSAGHSDLIIVDLTVAYSNTNDQVMVLLSDLDGRFTRESR